MNIQFHSQQVKHIQETGKEKVSWCVQISFSFKIGHWSV